MRTLCAQPRRQQLRVASVPAFNTDGLAEAATYALQNTVREPRIITRTGLTGHFLALSSPHHLIKASYLRGHGREGSGDGLHPAGWPSPHTHGRLNTPAHCSLAERRLQDPNPEPSVYLADSRRLGRASSHNGLWVPGKVSRVRPQQIW